MFRQKCAANEENVGNSTIFGENTEIDSGKWVYRRRKEQIHLVLDITSFSIAQKSNSEEEHKSLRDLLRHQEVQEEEQEHQKPCMKHEKL